MTPAREKPEPPTLGFESAAAFEEWLASNHADLVGIWLKIYKKGTGIASITYDEALETALCYGWIDGQKRPGDAQFFLQRFTPRRPRSAWSKRNTEIVERLTADGRMRPPGLAQVEAAQRDGRWEAAYASPSKLTVPPDFQEALDAVPAAGAAFETLDRTNRYAMLYRVTTAKRAETRAARIRTFVEMLVKGERLHP